MAERQKFYVHLSALISQARLKRGYATLKELYRDKRPQLDYQTWLNAESGRRIPSAAVVIAIADTLAIDHQSIILAYCKDKFPSQKSQQALDTLRINKFVDIDTLLDAEEHNRSKQYVFSAEELGEMKKDIRLRMYLTYTYDNDGNTTIQQLAEFFHDTYEDAKNIIARLVELNLLELNNDNVKKVHRHTSIPQTPENFFLRKDLLLKSLERSLKPDSYITNYHVSMTRQSYRRVLAFFDVMSANLIKLNEDDEGSDETFRFQITLTGNSLNSEEHPNDGE